MCIITTLSSEPGCGKTFQSMTFEEPILHLDMENRGLRTKERFYKDKMVSVINCQKMQDYKENHIATLTTLQSELDQHDRLKEYATVVIDGTSDIREFATTKWAKENKRKRPANPGDWEQINDMVRELIYPVINFCKINNIHLVLTTQFKDEYGLDKEYNSAKIGRIPAIKEWLSYNMDTLIQLEQRKNQYYAKCTKSIVGHWEENITGKSLFNILLEKQV